MRQYGHRPALIARHAATELNYRCGRQVRHCYNGVLSFQRPAIRADGAVVSLTNSKDSRCMHRCVCSIPYIDGLEYRADRQVPLHLGSLTHCDPW